MPLQSSLYFWLRFPFLVQFFESLSVFFLRNLVADIHYWQVFLFCSFIGCRLNLLLRHQTRFLSHDFRHVNAFFSGLALLWSLVLVTVSLDFVSMRGTLVLIIVVQTNEFGVETSVDVLLLLKRKLFERGLFGDDRLFANDFFVAKDLDFWSKFCATLQTSWSSIIIFLTCLTVSAILVFMRILKCVTWTE